MPLGIAINSSGGVSKRSLIPGIGDVATSMKEQDNQPQKQGKTATSQNNHIKTESPRGYRGETGRALRARLRPTTKAAEGIITQYEYASISHVQNLQTIRTLYAEGHGMAEQSSRLVVVKMKS